MEYTITRADTTWYDYFINDISINDCIFQQDLVDYRIEDREDLIEQIYDWIWEAKPSDRELMKQDIRYLEKLNDKYVFSSISTNEYVAQSDTPDAFNEICEEILEENKKFN